MTPPGQILSARDVAARGKRPFGAPAGFSPFPPGGPEPPGEAPLRFLGRESGEGTGRTDRTGGRRDRKEGRIEGCKEGKKEGKKERKNERKTVRKRREGKK